jgi:hypothetical protein
VCPQQSLSFVLGTHALVGLTFLRAWRKMGVSRQRPRGNSHIVPVPAHAYAEGAEQVRHVCVCVYVCVCVCVCRAYV